MREQVWSRVGLLRWTVIVSLSAWSAAGAAETLPASVRACAALTDSLQRLVCYDREVARFPEPAAKTATKPEAAPAKSASTPTPPASTPSGAAMSSSTGSATAATNTEAAGNDQAAAPPSASAAPRKDSGRISARVVTIDRQPNEMVLHLDNGQVWQQLQSVSGDLSLREGDTVKIEKRLGAYWLSGPHVSSMRVKQIS
jgi:hypothetical protein